MRTLTASLGGKLVTIRAPRHGEFDRGRFDADLDDSRLGLDVESTGVDHHADGFSVRLIQFATTETAWVLDLADPPQREAAHRLLADGTRRFVSHTSMDVVSVAVEFGVDISGRNLDTHVLGSIAHPDRAGKGGIDLKELVVERIGPELGQAQERLHEHFATLWTGRQNAKKSDVESHGWREVSPDEEAYLVYAGLDAIAVRQLADLLLRATETPARWINVDLWIGGQFARRQAEGVLVDRSAAEQLLADCERAVAGPTEAIMDITGLRPTQGQKLREFFLANGVDQWVAPRTKTGALSLRKDDLPALRHHDLTDDGREALEALLLVRDQQDALGKATQILNGLDADDRLHPRMKAIGAPTARMSCSGFNLQAVSKSDRRQRGLFLPEPGKVFAGIDSDQIELRLTAALTGERSMYDVVINGGDLHQLTADKIGVERSVAKVVNFMIVYGGGGAAVAAKTGLPRDVCDAHVAAFKQAYPSITEYADRAARMSTLVTGSGRRLARASGDRSYANINYLIQSFARDLLAAAWYRFATEFGHADKVWLPIHDELILEIPDGEVDQVIADAETCMNFDFRGMPFSATGVPLFDEYGVSRWMGVDTAEEIAAQVSREHRDLLSCDVPDCTWHGPPSRDPDRESEPTSRRFRPRPRVRRSGIPVARAGVTVLARDGRCC